MLNPNINRSHLARMQPLAYWEFEDCFTCAEREGFPLHPLHEQGYPSMGDVQSTVPMPREQWFEYGMEHLASPRRLTKLKALLPGLDLCSPRLHATLVMKLLTQPRRVAACLLALRAALPAADVAAIVAGWPALLIMHSPQEIAASVQRIRCYHLDCCTLLCVKVGCSKTPGMFSCSLMTQSAGFQNPLQSCCTIHVLFYGFMKQLCMVCCAVQLEASTSGLWCRVFDLFVHDSSFVLSCG